MRLRRVLGLVRLTGRGLQRAGPCRRSRILLRILLMKKVTDRHGNERRKRTLSFRWMIVKSLMKMKKKKAKMKHYWKMNFKKTKRKNDRRTVPRMIILTWI
uniref:Uncharacterized protein n=1 Tax=Cacopsylla melanoneura TaxID=428564 RepID=A0A8D8V0L0_9HEMI